MDYCLPGSSVHGGSPGKNTGVACHALLQGVFPCPGIEPRSSTLQADSLLSEPPGQPESAGVGSLSLLQGIFLTQELNWCLLCCRQILYQLSYQGSPTRKHTSRILISSDRSTTSSQQEAKNLISPEIQLIRVRGISEICFLWIQGQSLLHSNES